ncbi:MAG: hypothetical protein AB1894_04525 [Chloroflexota bacterium]
MKTNTARLFIPIVCLVILFSTNGFSSAFQASTYIYQHNNPYLNVDFSGWQGIVSLSHEVAIRKEIQRNVEALGFGDNYILTAFDESFDGFWARAVIVPSYVVEAGWENLSTEEIIELLMKKSEDNSWNAYIYNSPEFHSVKKDVTRSFIDFSFMENYPTSVEEYHFPWTYGHSWWKNGGWHTGYWGLPNNAIDFQPKSTSDVAVLAAANGTLGTVCDRPDDPDQIWLKMTNADGTTGYGHIDKQSFNRDLFGQAVTRGTSIGNLYNPGGSFSTYCGYGTGTHLHFVFPTTSGISMYDLETERDVPASEIGQYTPIGEVSYTSANTGGGGNICSSTVNLPSGYSWCANEGGTCSFSGTADVAYGADNKYTIKTGIANSIACTNDAFGCDPNYGVTKACYFKNLTAPCNPNNDQIALFVEPDYKGDCVVKNYGDYRNSGSIGLSNDSISSIKVGANALAVICEHDDYYGSCNIFTGDDSNLSDNGPGGEWVSSVWVDNRNPSYKALLYENSDYSGAACGITGAGGGDMCSGLDNTTSSIRILPGWSARVWRDPGYNGPNHCFTSSDHHLGDNNFDDGSSMDNQISSFIAYNQSNCPPVGSPPDTPTLISPYNGSFFNEGENISLSWSDTGNEYYGEVWGGPATVMVFGWQSENFKDIGSQWAGYAYTWKVKARNDWGESDFTLSRTFYVYPAAPTNLLAQAASCNQINLTWNDNSGNEDGYRIYRDGSHVGTVGANVQSFQDNGLSGNTNYSYIVRTYHGSYESIASNTADAITPSCNTPPSTPTNLHQDGATYTSLLLSWNDVANETGYNLYRLGVSDFEFLASISANVNHYFDTSLTCSEVYVYYITAFNNFGESDPSPYLWAFTSICPKIYLPVILNAQPTSIEKTIYGQTTDGEVLNLNCSDWLTCRNASSGNARWQDMTVGTVGAGFSSSNSTYLVERVFLFFDTSIIPSNANISSATLHLHSGQFLNGNNKIHMVPSTALIPLSISDFSRFSFISGGAVTPISPNAWMTVNFNSTALGWIVKNGLTKLALLNDLDLYNITPTSSNDVLVGLGEDSLYKPYLTIIYTLP